MTLRRHGFVSTEPGMMLVAVPRRRMLKADGSTVAQRWGVHRKRRLLAIGAAA